MAVAQPVKSSLAPSPPSAWPAHLPDCLKVGEQAVGSADAERALPYRHRGGAQRQPVDRWVRTQARPAWIVVALFDSDSAFGAADLVHAG